MTIERPVHEIHTVGELRAFIAQLPDETRVCYLTSGAISVKSAVSFSVRSLDQHLYNEHVAESSELRARVERDDFPGVNLVVWAGP